MSKRKQLSDCDLFFGLGPTLTDEQKQLIDALFNPDIKVIVIPSVAGTGKTSLVVGATKIMQKDLVYVFPNVSEDEFGFLPGNLFEKYYNNTYNEAM